MRQTSTCPIRVRDEFSESHSGTKQDIVEFVNRSRDDNFV